MTSRYFKYNHNPKQLKTGDCSVRAIGVALDIDWYEAFDLQAVAARETCSCPGWPTAVTKVMEDAGFEWVGAKAAKGTRRGTVDSFAQAHPKGRYLLRVANHFVTVVDGFYYDIWDCGCKSVYGYYKKERRYSMKIPKIRTLARCQNTDPEFLCDRIISNEAIKCKDVVICTLDSIYVSTQDKENRKCQQDTHIS